jgi:hypothetical protein
MISSHRSFYSELGPEIDEHIQLVFTFFKRENWSAEIELKLKKKYPNADIIYASSSGHAHGNKIMDDEIVVNCISFESTQLNCVSVNISDYHNSREAGKMIGQELFDDSCKYIGIISDGAMVNGTQLCQGINDVVKGEIPVTGGLAGDMTNFEKTIVGLNQAPKPGEVVGIKMSGSLEVVSSSQGGFIPFGMEMKITGSENNILRQIDNKNAYDVLYNVLAPNDKQDFENNLLYFPLMVDSIDSKNIIRTPIVVDHEKKEIIYAGDMPKGATIQVTRTNSMDMLNATTRAINEVKEKLPGFQLLFTVSCVGRRIVLDVMKDEELTELEELLPDGAKNIGFYSYGEINTRGNTGDNCELHNQTLTLTAFKEI